MGTKIALVLGIGGAIALHNTPTLAQITPDATLGVESSQVISPTPGGFPACHYSSVFVRLISKFWFSS